MRKLWDVIIYLLISLSIDIIIKILKIYVFVYVVIFLFYYFSWFYDDLFNFELLLINNVKEEEECIENLNKLIDQDQAFNFLMAYLSLSASAFSNLIWLLAPFLNPPIIFPNYLLSLKWALKAVAKLLTSTSSSFLTSVRATTAAFFWWTNLPRAAFPLTKQYGMSNFLQRFGNQTTSSIGSTLLAMTTSLVFFYSMSLVTWLSPNLRWNGLAFLTYFSEL